MQFILSAVCGAVQLAAVHRGMEVERSFVSLKPPLVSSGKQLLDWTLQNWLSSAAILSEGNANK